jgi:hypothetical protein
MAEKKEARKFNGLLGSAKQATPWALPNSWIMLPRAIAWHLLDRLLLTQPILMQCGTITICR